MSWRLFGPFPVELGAPAAAARLALERASTLGPLGTHPMLREAGAKRPEPGLYLLIRQGERPEIAGFWLTFGPSYLEGGPLADATAPPFVTELLNAATEAVWWRLLPVWPRQGDTWTPLLVLDWPASLARRASLPPPGVPGGGAPLRSAVDDDGGWMEDDGPRARPRAAAIVEEEAAPLPDDRGLLYLTRGQLSRGLGVHRGQVEGISPGALPAALSDLPMEGWLEALFVERREPGAPPPAEHHQGPPLRLSGSAVAFPLSGWLRRDLEVAPASPASLGPVPLPERDIGSRWRAWLSSTLSSVGAVLLLTLGLAALLHLAARPRLELAPAPPARAAQPAMSVCSADHQAFVAELRCQVAWMAGGGSIDEAVCGDRDATLHPSPPVDADLQADWCGLNDRALDGWTAGGGDWADLATSRACYNVLGHPYTYERPGTRGQPEADPDRFLRSRDLGISALIELRAQLSARCETWRGRATASVEGAIFASSVGVAVDPEIPPARRSEPAALRAMLMESATAGLSADQDRCFRAGVQGGIIDVSRYSDLCGGTVAVDDPKAWIVLGGASPSEPSLLRRYTQARFGPTATPSAEPWACHVSLADGTARPGRMAGRWDLGLPALTAYNVSRGLVQSQLVLDAGLRAMLEDDASPDPCWQVTAGTLTRYAPVYPLLAPPDPGAWPSVEQQVCGQLCAVWTRVRSGEGGLATPGTDLGLCVNPQPPSGSPEQGVGRLDALRLPWNEVDREGWRAPSAAAICAFNLVAQGYFDPASGAVLPQGVAPAQWAGSTSAGSGLAGGVDGVAADAAVSMSSYGRTRSTRTCGAVAAQCFATGLTQVTSNGELASYQWPASWEVWLQQVVDGAEASSPWCSLIQPYLRLDGSLPEGQLDYPCVRGVDEARRGFEAQVSALAASAARRTP